MKLLALCLLACGAPPAMPTSWTQVGHAPDGAALAIEVVAELNPDLPRGGTVYWHDGPFPCLSNAADSMGCTFPTRDPGIEVMFLPLVEQTGARLRAGERAARGARSERSSRRVGGGDEPRSGEENGTMTEIVKRDALAKPAGAPSPVEVYLQAKPAMAGNLRVVLRLLGDTLRRAGLPVGGAPL